MPEVIKKDLPQLFTKCGFIDHRVHFEFFRECQHAFDLHLARGGQKHARTCEQPFESAVVSGARQALRILLVDAVCDFVLLAL